MNQKPIENYTPLAALDPKQTIFVSHGEWEQTLMKRRMTVMRIRSGGLLVHNPFRLHEADLKKLKEMGTVVGILSPNIFHNSDTPWFSAQFPSAKVFCPLSQNRKMSKQGIERPRAFETEWPTEWTPDVLCISLPGLRWLDESVFIHHPSKSLILTDLAFNMQGEAKGFEKSIMKWNRAFQGFGPSRIFESVFLKNRSQFSQGLRQILAEDFDRVIVNHGAIVESEARSVFERAFSSLIVPR
jgi:hypothetical protein